MTEEFKPTEQKVGSGLKFDVAEEDIFLIGLAVSRFMDFLRGRDVLPTDTHAKNLHMDLGATHCNGCPLDFSALMAMELTPFVEDIMGISKNLDRQTGKLLNNYRPRCAKSKLLLH